MYSSNNHVNAYQFLLIRNGTVTIAKSSSSSLPSELEFPFVVEVGTWYDLEASIEENRIEFHINGQLVGVVADQDILTSGRVGLVVSNARVQFDDVEITGDGIPHGGPGNSYIVDQEVPTIVFSNLLEGATDIDPIVFQKSGFSADFSEEINNGKVELKSISGVVISSESKWENQKVTLTLLAGKTLEYGISYQIVLSDVSDKVGNPLVDNIITFTAMERETIVPKVTGGNLTSGDTSVDPIYFSGPETGITFEFSEDILPGNIELKIVDGETVPIEAKWEERLVTIALLAGKTLAYETNYVISLNDITDLVGNPLENGQITFTTSNLPNAFSWTGVVTVTSDDKNVSPSQLTFGSAAGATVNYDEGLDVVAPPAPQPPVKLDAYLVSSEGFTSRLLSDFKPSEQSMSYPFKVRSDLDKFTLSWDLSGLPKEFTVVQLRQVAPVSDLTVDMTTETEVSFNSNPDQYYNFELTLSPSVIWSGSILISSSDQQVSTTSIKFGMAKEATESYDVGLEIVAPPASISPVQLDAYLPTQSQYVTRLLSDFRPESESVSYTLKVRADISDFSLAWDISQLPANFTNAKLKQIEPASNLIIDIKAASGASFSALSDQYYSFEISLSPTVPIHLSPGWNMISIPGIPQETDPATLQTVDNSLILPLYRWNSATFSYESVTELKFGEGYWALTIKPEGTTLEILVISANSYDRSLQPGWNMIGGVSQVTDFTNPQDNPDNSIISGTLYGWNPTNFSYQAKTEIAPGQGYWVLTMVECQLTVDGDATVPTAPQVLPDPEMVIALNLSAGDWHQNLDIGLDQSATDGLEPMDRALPPTGPQAQDY
ncbi:MAG: Ig-like domain-containing protein, partial [Candidatus Poribacteria bacterium]|nr:Ig-like domain-containing protein [Candidatus Poribacteria bacterium]